MHIKLIEARGLADDSSKTWDESKHRHGIGLVPSGISVKRLAPVARGTSRQLSVRSIEMNIAELPLQGRQVPALHRKKTFPDRKQHDRKWERREMSVRSGYFFLSPRNTPKNALAKRYRHRMRANKIGL